MDENHNVNFPNNENAYKMYSAFDQMPAFPSSEWALLLNNLNLFYNLFNGSLVEKYDNTCFS
jgi:hypothetical protein